MLGTYFYHQRTRTAVAIFGRLFSDLYVLRPNRSQLKVPLAYAPRQKFLERIRQQPDLDNDQKVAVKLPRMSFEMIDMSYDPTRQLAKTTNFTSGGTITTRNKFFAAVPYNLQFQLHIYARSQDDALQLVEQIIPFFGPQYNVTIIPFPQSHPTVREDVPLTITGVDVTDDYEGDVASRRTIIYTISFDMKVNYYSAIPDDKIIKEARLNFNLEQPTILAGYENNYLELKLSPNPEGVSSFEEDFVWDYDYEFYDDI